MFPSKTLLSQTQTSRGHDVIVGIRVSQEIGFSRVHFRANDTQNHFYNHAYLVKMNFQWHLKNTRKLRRGYIVDENR